jgi:hypothetical protein
MAAPARAAETAESANAAQRRDGERDGSAERRGGVRRAHEVAVERDPVLGDAPLQRRQRLTVVADAVVDGV